VTISPCDTFPNYIRSSAPYFTLFLMHIGVSLHGLQSYKFTHERQLHYTHCTRMQEEFLFRCVNHVPHSTLLDWEQPVTDTVGIWCATAGSIAQHTDQGHSIATVHRIFISFIWHRQPGRFPGEDKKSFTSNRLIWVSGLLGTDTFNIIFEG
jgi:hypothetical protein